jgi:hypothetical protein
MHEYSKVSVDYLESAPQKLVFEMDLPVTPAALFSIFERSDTWQWAGIEDVIWDREPPFNAETKRTIVQPSGNRLDEQFLVWEQDYRMVFRIDRGDVDMLSALIEDYTVVPVGENGCRFTWTIGYELRGWRQVLAPLLSIIVRLMFKNMVKDFQAMVEQQRST